MLGLAFMDGILSPCRPAATDTASKSVYPGVFTRITDGKADGRLARVVIARLGRKASPAFLVSYT